ncbi:neuraminidase-like domain-containing protein [Trinickia symbiotica]|uniref:neuraminidase-like domain-containing protein n=1 Tax=Trinickia symbiotica TaxID=863227 RepID=UPI00131A9477|nr:neuraminidase-like domain-containing protein [Trinickia symbiotica]
MGGQVNIELQPTSTGKPVWVRNADASKEIELSDPSLQPGADYQITVTPSDVPNPVSQTVSIPASGFASVKVVIDKNATAAPYSLQGSLTTDRALPAAGITVRLFAIGFGGKDIALGEMKSDANGRYAFSYSPQTSAAPNLQVRALDPAGKEIVISAIKFDAMPAETMNLVVPTSVHPLAPEFQRLTADVAKVIGTGASLDQAQENADRKDLTLLNRTAGWDARLVALAATAAQHAGRSGLGQDVLYALFRIGLPTDPALLATVPAATVQQALAKGSNTGIVQLSSDQIETSTRAFEDFATRTMIASTAPGSVSSFQNLLATHIDNQANLADFAKLYFSQPTAGATLWKQAADLKIPSATVDALKLQGKFLYLTFNNGTLAQKLQQDIGSIDNLPTLAAKDYHKPATWQAALTALSDGGKTLDALIPPAYAGSATVDRLNAYCGDLARRVALSFPTHTVARMVESKEFAVDPHASATLPTFLRAAANLGYSLGRTPLNSFLAKSGKNLPALDDASTRSLKTLHRLYQVTPSNESLQAALKMGFTSARDIASYSKADFINRYGYAFPNGEAEIVYGQAQTISSVTFNFYAMAKALDTVAPVYALSSSADNRQAAKNALVEQFPSMSSLFGNMDYGQCQDCQSVLSPAAYFVDLLDLLGNESAPNAAGNTPLDVLIGKGGGIIGRRPDLGALPLTCANTDTAMPYIDVVNEIFEYYIAHAGTLGAGAAYDTGTTSTADLTAEPQHILPSVYTTTLKQARYPLDLPFDLWIETVRGFLNYFKTSLTQVLDTMRPADTLELFTSNPATSYYRANILAESLGISPAEYSVLTAIDTSSWFKLYGNYANEAAALIDLKSARTLAQKLGVSYQGLTDLVKTGFVNAGLYPLLYQFERFGIDLDTAFSYTNQPGRPALTAQQKSDFENQLADITARYKLANPASGFDAKTWLTKLLTANYAQTVLVLADPDTGYDFSATTLQYADGSPARPLDFLKLNLFVRLCRKLGCSLNDDTSAVPSAVTPWSLDEIDRSMQTFLPAKNLPAWTDASFGKAYGDAWKTALIYLAHLDDLYARLAPQLGRVALLSLWSDLPVHGENPLYAQLFLGASVLNNDFAFDDPSGAFPTASIDLTADQRALVAHAAVIQGALGLSVSDIATIMQDAGTVAPPSFSLGNLSLCYRYSLLAQSLGLSVANMISLKTLSGLNPFQPLGTQPLQTLSDDILLGQTLAFVQQVSAALTSGFTVEDLQYLLRHQYDPVGPYQFDPNALIATVQTVSNGLRQIQSANAVPSDPASMPESLIDQDLSGLFPPVILKTLFAHLTNAQTYAATATSATALAAADFISAPEITLAYDNVTQTQTLGCKGLLPDWRKTGIKALNTQAALNGVLGNLLDGVQQQARMTIARSLSDVLGVWASLAQYEAVATGVDATHAISDPLGQLAQADPALAFTYNPAEQLQWVGYRGVLTAAKLGALTAINGSATLAALLAQIQQQALPAYNAMCGNLLAMWSNANVYKVTQSGIAAADQIDAAAFAAALAQAQRNNTISSPVPTIRISYDNVTQTQSAVCAGVLTQTLVTQLSALLASPLLGNLLQALRAQAVNQFQFLANGLLAPSLNDPDPFAAPYVGGTAVQQQKFAKATLVSVFLPLQARKQSSQLVLQTLSSQGSTDPALLEALLTDAALLDDPSNPGKSLLQAFLAVGTQGIGATYYDQTNAALANPVNIAATADTAGPGNSIAGAVSCRYEGYLQVPTDGPYRFFAELGNAGTQVTFQLDTPDPDASLTNPVIRATASGDGEEVSQFVPLKGGLAYRFTLDFRNFGHAGARMLIQGESLPKGPLSQIVLYAQPSVDAFARANTLVSKALHILGVTGLNPRELSYLATHAAQFNNFRLSALPTQASDDSPQKAAQLFAQFLTLIDYADLRKGPAGGTDGLIDVFEAAATPSGLQASYYTSVDTTGAPQASVIAATADTSEPGNSKPGTASCRYEGYVVVPVNGSYEFFAELGKAGAQVTLRLDAPQGTAPLANPVVLQHTAAADGEEGHQAVFLMSGTPYRLTLEFMNLGNGNASLQVQGANLGKGPLNQLVLYPVSQLPPWQLLANLTRRDPQVVRDLAAALGTTPHYVDNTGIRRMWQALQLVQILGLPVQEISASTAIVTAAPGSPDQIAARFKNAVKGKYSIDQWRPIAQSVFDPLRRKRRDALVTYLLDTLQLQSANQLYEYFLVDPGMEPVVQTSRLRLAMSSVQTFIQRCFLNLESGNSNASLDVASNAIPSNWWDWMKRYRLWDANREIFLFPENWMEPEFRLDKTDLFQALESALLQGDVTQDLAEAAYAEYLKGLELRARLDIVASYLDQNTINPGESALYVLGRTYPVPHKYFFRTFANGTWSGWIPVPFDIDGDHMVLAIWRGRLNLFWVSFMNHAQQSASSPNDSRPAGQIPLDALQSDISSGEAEQQILIQLHWSEYVQGKWTNRISSDPGKFEALNVGGDFSPDRDVYIHVDKEVDASGNEGAVRILLDMNGFDSFYGFRVTSKNCDPDFGSQYAEFAPELVYNAPTVDATRFDGSAVLQASFQTTIAADGSGTIETENILQSVNQFGVLTCSNSLVPPFLPPNEPDYREAGSLVGPFFYKDNSNPQFASQSTFQDERTFFVQPSLTEQVIREWEGWAILPYWPNPVAVDPNTIKKLPVEAQVPALPIPVGGGDPAYSVYQVRNPVDWVTRPGVAVSYGGTAIGKGGGIASYNGNGLIAANGHASIAGGINLIGRQGAIAGLFNMASVKLSPTSADL